MLLTKNEKTFLVFDLVNTGIRKKYIINPTCEYIESSLAPNMNPKIEYKNIKNAKYTSIDMLLYRDPLARSIIDTIKTTTKTRTTTYIIEQHPIIYLSLRKSTSHRETSDSPRMCVHIDKFKV